MEEHKKKAWIVTAVLLFLLASWTLYAVHDAAVLAAKAARAKKSDSSITGATAGCPFSKTPTEDTNAANATKKDGSSCCNSKSSGTDSSKAKTDFTKLADMTDDDIEEFKKQFTPEQLAKCPHLKARESKNKKN